METKTKTEYNKISNNNRVKSVNNILVNKNNYFEKLNFKLKPTLRAILDLLVNYSKNYIAYPSQQYIAERLHIHRTTVNRAIKKLSESKIITVIKNKTKEQKYVNNSYFLNFLFISKNAEKVTLSNVLEKTYRKIEERFFAEVKESTSSDVKIEEDVLLEYVEELREKTGLKTVNVLATLVNISEQIKGNHIFNLYKYMESAFNNAIKQQSVKDKILSIGEKFTSEQKQSLMIKDILG